MTKHRDPANRRNWKVELHHFFKAAMCRLLDHDPFEQPMDTRRHCRRCGHIFEANEGRHIEDDRP